MHFFLKQGFDIYTQPIKPVINIECLFLNSLIECRLILFQANEHRNLFIIAECYEGHLNEEKSCF